MDALAHALEPISIKMNIRRADENGSQSHETHRQVPAAFFMWQTRRTLKRPAICCLPAHWPARHSGSPKQISAMRWHNPSAPIGCAARRSECHYHAPYARFALLADKASLGKLPKCSARTSRAHRSESRSAGCRYRCQVSRDIGIPQTLREVGVKRR